VVRPRAGGSEAVEVGLEAVRPGWMWAGSRWTGLWVPKVRNRRQEERDATFRQVQAAWPLEAAVEVMQTDPGMAGSWYEGEVLEHEYPDKLVIKYLELHDLEAEEAGPQELGKTRGETHFEAPGLVQQTSKTRMVTPEPVKHVRPRPPPVEDGWDASLRLGDAVDLRFDGGWWEMELVRLEEAAGGAPRRYTIKSVHFDVQHCVTAGQLRPPHAWSAEGAAGGAWVLRAPPQVHMLDGVPRVVEEEQGGRSKRRRKDEQRGQPADKAAHFGVGTKRRGADGRMWEVSMTEKLAEVWQPCDRGASPLPGREGDEARGGRRGREAAAEAAVEPLSEAERREIALAPVLENELKASGISVKKGYEDLVYEAVVHLAGEATPPSMRNEIALEKTRTVL